MSEPMRLKMDALARFMRGRLCAALLSAPLALYGLDLYGKLSERAGYRATAQSGRRAGMTLLGLVEGRLSGKTRQEIEALLEPLYETHPSFRNYKANWPPSARDAPEKDCLPYGGAYFVFHDGKFAFFDTERRCDRQRRSGWFYKEDL